MRDSGAGCCGAPIQSSTLQNNWPAVEQAPAVLTASACSVAAHYTPISWSERSNICFLGPGVVTTWGGNTDHGVILLVAMAMLDRVESSSVKMRNINQEAIAAVSICRCAGVESTQYLRQFLSAKLHVAP